jgi:hypothetical protein
MNDVFSQHLDSPFKILDDGAAVAWIVQFGLLNKFWKTPLSESGRPRKYGEILSYPDHPTHWVFAFRFTGFPEAADNGYALHCFPKSQFSFADVGAIVDAQNRQMLSGGVTMRFMTTSQPHN